MTAPDTQRIVVVITGVSGAGRTTALHVLEDLSFYCVDNLPTPLLTETIALWHRSPSMRRLGIGLDVRVGEFLASADEAIRSLRASGEHLGVVFLDAADEALVRRFSETRRPHPLAASFPDDDVAALIHRERERLGDLRALADQVIDTTRLNVHDLRRLLIDHFRSTTGTALRMQTRVVSFGFKYGVPADADLVFDARFLANPHFVPELRPRSGRDPAVAAFVLEHPEGREFLDALERFVAPLLPRYAREGKVVLTVAVGCTGGRHRSVALAEALGARIKTGAPGDVTVAHRDIDRGG
jgi:RNase adapter protein RapZ